MSLICATLALPVLNLAIDPTELFDTGLLPQTHQVNDRYRKIDYLLHHCHDCTGFLLGSSRMGYTDPSLFDGFLSRGRCYNMNLSSANAWDHLEFAGYLHRKGIRPELLVIQLDVVHMFGHYVKFEHHPDYSGESSFRFYFENLFSLPYESLYGKLRANLRGQSLNEFEWQTGRRSKPEEERRLQQDAEAYVRAEPDFQVTAGRPLYESDRHRRAIDQTVEAMRELKRLADRDGYRLIVFITPHNQHYLDRYRTEDIAYFLTELSRVMPFWNFASYSSVTTDDRNYYEAEHHRPKVAELVAARIAGRQDAGVPDDFGRWVSRDTLEPVLEELRSRFGARRRAGLRSE